jgi:hypothetical protein
MKQLISADASALKKTEAAFDGEGGLIIRTTQDVTAIVEQNKAQYNSTSSREKWDDLTKVASLPFTIIDTLNRKGIMRGFAVIDEKEFRRFLNDPDNRFFRTRPGIV